MKENSVIDRFWNDAYAKWRDGGYINDDEQLVECRFELEKDELEKFLKRHIPPERRARALDVGCGNGRFCRVLADYFERVDGIDIAETAIRRNRLENRNGRIDYHCVPFSEFSERARHRYDFVYIGGVLMYIRDEELERSYRGLSRILAKQGVALLRESVMDRKRVDRTGEEYVAFYRRKDFYTKIGNLELMETKENLAYRIGELRNVMKRLGLGSLFDCQKAEIFLPFLKIKSFLWKPGLNRLVNYYYLHRKKGENDEG